MLIPFISLGAAATHILMLLNSVMSYRQCSALFLIISFQHSIKEYLNDEAICICYRPNDSLFNCRKHCRPVQSYRDTQSTGLFPLMILFFLAYSDGALHYNLLHSNSSSFWDMRLAYRIISHNRLFCCVIIFCYCFIHYPFIINHLLAALCANAVMFLPLLSSRTDFYACLLPVF